MNRLSLVYLHLNPTNLIIFMGISCLIYAFFIYAQFLRNAARV